MALHPLADFLETLLAAGQLVRVAVEVDPKLEAAELTRRVAAAGGPALLLDRLRGQSIPLVTNLLGTPQRLCLAFGVDRLDDLAARLESLTQNGTQNWLKRLRSTTELPAAEKYQPRSVKTGLCQQVVRLGRDIQLAQLPALGCWPDESGPTLSAAQAITYSHSEKLRSLSLCRLQVLGDQRLSIVDDGPTGLSRHAAEAARQGERLPVVLAFGGDPAGLLAAALPLRLDVDGLMLCGLLRDKPLDVVKARSQPLDVPADADLVIEGFIEPPDAVAATFTLSLAARQPSTGDPSVPVLTASGVTNGYYRLPQPGLVLHVTAVTQRTSPILPAFVYGQASGDLATLQAAVERILLPVVRSAIGELVDYALPAIGGLHSFVVLAIRKTSPHQARKVASAVWGLDLLSSTKIVVIVDALVDVHDTRQVLAEIGANVHPGRDVFFHQGQGDPGDHAAPVAGLGQPMGMDATSKLPAEHSGAWPSPLAISDQVSDLVSRRWAEYGLAGKPPRS